MMTLLNELNKTIELLEQQIPASPARNESLEQGLKRELSNYFKGLDDALDWNGLEAIYYKAVGMAESDRPASSVVSEEPLVEATESVVIQGLPGEKGEKGDRGDTGERGEQGLLGLKGDKGNKGDKGDGGEKGIQGERGEQGEQGERGLQGLVGKQSERGEKGDTGDPGLTKKEQTNIKKIISEFTGKKFVEDDDPRLKDKREPKEHKHPEIQPISFAYPMVNVAGVAGGIQSKAPEGYLEVTNVYYDPITEKMVVVYKS